MRVKLRVKILFNKHNNDIKNIQYILINFTNRQLKIHSSDIPSIILIA